jgi:hypothetical protein
LSLLGKNFYAAVSVGSGVEGVVVSHNLTNDRVTIIDEDDFTWSGYAYQLEPLDDLGQA